VAATLGWAATKEGGGQGREGAVAQGTAAKERGAGGETQGGWRPRGAAAHRVSVSGSKKI
jgi:hypothetical protein